MRLERLDGASLPIVVPKRQKPDQGEIRKDTVVGDGGRMSVGQPIRCDLMSDLRDTAPEQPGVTVEVKGIPCLHAGIAPPLRLLAPRSVHVSIKATALLRPRTGLPYLLQQGIGTLKPPLVRQGVAHPAQSHPHIQSHRALANHQFQKTESERQVKLMDVLTRPADQSVPHGDSTSTPLARMWSQRVMLNRFVNEHVAYFPTLRTTHLQNRHAHHRSFEIEQVADKTPAARRPDLHMSLGHR